MQCECKNGFYYDDTIVACIDIDECQANANICDRNADCYNQLGGYSCRCRDGFHGNGYTCYPESVSATTEEQTTQNPTVESTPNLEHWLCDQCSEHADCVQGVCVCRNGWNGDGIECAYNCQDDSVWNIDRCEPINPNSDEEEG